MPIVRKPLVSFAMLVPRGRLVDYLRRSTFHWLIPVALIAVSMVGYSVIQVHRHQAAFLQAQAQHIKKELELDLERRQHGLKSIAALAAATDPTLDSAHWYRLARDYDLVFGTPVILADSDRRILFNTRAPLGATMDNLPKPPGRSALKEALLTGEPQVGDVVFAPILGRKLVTVIVPFKQRHALLGLIVLPEIEELLARQALPVGWNVSVHDSVGNFIASSAERSLDPQAGSSARRVVLRSPGAPWVVVLEASLWSFYRPHIGATLILALCISLAFACGILASNKASQGVLGSLQRLLTRQAPTHSGDRLNASASMPRIEEFEVADAELRRQMRHRYEIEESTRAQTASDLQDRLQQDATAAAMHLQVLKSQLDTGGTMHQTASAAAECVHRLIKEISGLVQDLCPASERVGGLSQALNAYTEHFSAATGVHAELDILGDASRVEGLPKPISDCLYRVAQACLDIARTHAHASFVHLELDVRTPAQIRMTVMDDGVGPPLKSQSQGRDPGMQGVTDRVSAMHGTVEAMPGHDQSSKRGTTITITLPIFEA